MPYLLKISESDALGKRKFVNHKGNTECVTFIQQATDAPHTTKWIRGRSVKSFNEKDPLKRGTAIATFDADGKYPKDNKGKHAAIYLSHNADGIRVLDQWNSKEEVTERTIRFNQPDGTYRANDGDAFYVIN